MFYAGSGAKLIVLLISMVVAAILEMAGVGLIMPFIAIIDKPEIINENAYLSYIYNLSSVESYKEFLLFFSGLLVVFYIVKNAFLSAIIYWQSAFLSLSEAELSKNILKKYLSMPYLRYINRNSAELVNNISVEVSLLFAGLIKPAFFIISDCFITISIMALLFYVAPVATISVVVLILIVTGLFYLFLRKPLSDLGHSRQYNKEKMVQWINQSLGSMKEIIVSGRSGFFANNFAKHADEMVKTQTFYETVIQMPRIVIETFGVVLLIVVMIVLINSGDNFIPTISLFAMAAFRLMPSINRATSCATKVRYYTKTLNTLHDDMLEIYPPTKKEGAKDVSFTGEISLNNIHFGYQAGGDNVLNGVDLKIKKGTSVGIIGPSGEGKSTLVDIILGLIEPLEGAVMVDGVNIRDNLRSWHKHLSYMPQSVYLTDDTIRRNIALGVADDEIDDELLWFSAKQAQLDGFINSQKEGLDTIVGDRGARISGGQRQRIGIARALYNRPDVLILDEATTALDPDTEQRICATLKEIAKDITIIAISHQPALISIADEVYRLKDGMLVKK